MALEGDQAVFPGLPVLLLAAKRTVPVEELEVALQYSPHLHLSLCGAAGVQDVDHGGQALQGQAWKPSVLGFRRGPAAPRSQDREQVLNGLRCDGEQAILLKDIDKEVYSH